MKSKNKNILTGYVGKISNTGLYKRVVNGREIIQRCPKRKKLKYNEKWPLQNRNFHLASQNAALLLHNPEIRALYEKVATGFSSPNAMAIKDFLKPAVISRVVTTGYLGRTGYCIVIHVQNIVPVKSVKITIESREGETIESGQAVMQRSGTEWHYLTTRPNPGYEAAVIRIISCDQPGHMVEWSGVL